MTSNHEIWAYTWFGRGLPSFFCLSLPAFPVAIYGRTGNYPLWLLCLHFELLIDGTETGRDFQAMILRIWKLRDDLSRTFANRIVSQTIAHTWLDEIAKSAKWQTSRIVVAIQCVAAIDRQHSTALSPHLRSRYPDEKRYTTAKCAAVARHETVQNQTMRKRYRYKEAPSFREV